MPRGRASCGSTSLRSRRPPSISPAKPKAPSTRCALCHSGKSKKHFLHFSFSKIPSLFWQQHSFCGLLSVFPGNERDFPLFFELVYFFLSSTIFRIYLFIYLELPILQLFVMQSKHFLTIFSKLWTNYGRIVNSAKFCRAFLWSLSLDFAAEVGDNGAVEAGHYAPIRKILYVSRRSPND